jgi:hypothetical protein
MQDMPVEGIIAAQDAIDAIIGEISDVARSREHFIGKQRVAWVSANQRLMSAVRTLAAEHRKARFRRDPPETLGILSSSSLFWGVEALSPPMPATPLTPAPARAHSPTTLSRVLSS